MRRIDILDAIRALPLRMDSARAAKNPQITPPPLPQPQNGPPLLKGEERGETSPNQRISLFEPMNPEARVRGEGGRVKVDAEGFTDWQADPAGRHAYVKINGDPAKLAAAIEELMILPPRLTGIQPKP
ncbi:MAG: hypothetical protein WCO56_15785 [Verrucomicrobiota bacterium]